MPPRHTKTFYLIGPPVETSWQVADVLLCVLTEMHSTGFEDFRVLQSTGLPYIKDWMFEGDTHQKHHRRPGMHGADLWCLETSWSRPQLHIPAFSVVVQDINFFSRPSEYRKRNAPAFETFLVSTCVDGAVPQGCLFRWNIAKLESWQSRSVWQFRPSDDDASVAEKQRVLGALMEPRWQDMLNLWALVPDPLEYVSRRRGGSQRGRSGREWEIVEDKITMDFFLLG